MTDPPPLMHATQVARPFHTPGWVYEERYDGWRMLVVKQAGVVRLVSRNGSIESLSPASSGSALSTTAT
jgi:bifunctional non-homologous end joining protein LigD